MVHLLGAGVGESVGGSCEDAQRLAGFHNDIVVAAAAVVVVVEHDTNEERVVVIQRHLQVADVVDDVVDDFDFGHLAVFWHVGHQFLQFRQVQLHFHLFGHQIGLANFAIHHNGRYGFARLRL